MSAPNYGRAINLARVYSERKLHEMAEGTEISKSLLCEIEKGKKSVTTANLTKIAEYCDVTVADFVHFAESVSDEKSLDNVRAFLKMMEGE